MIFSVKNGGFAYRKGQEILRNISFSTKEGEVLSILGPNGVGKTTLLRCMMGLLPWRAGGSYLDGINVSKIPSSKLWQKIAYVPQAKGFSFAYTIEEMVLFGRSAHLGLAQQPSKEDMRLCMEAMKTVGILHLREKYCNQVSGGELQMALIARALCTQPEILVLDEPESNLDFRNQLIILETIEGLAKEKGIACIFNTHYPAHALKISDYSLILSRDGTSTHGKSADVINSTLMKEVFQVNVHIHSVQKDGYDYQTVTAVSIV